MTTFGAPSPTQDEPQWQQPAFTFAASAPLSGEVLAPGQTRPSLPEPGSEERRLRVLRQVLWPLALVVAVLTGMWWQAFVVALVSSVVVKRRIYQLRYQRRAQTIPPSPGWQQGGFDLR